MNILNEYFDKIYCINLDRRPDRKQKCKDQFDRLGLEVEFFSAIDKEKITKNESNINDGQLACLSSHYNIIKMAKNKGYMKIIIFEDDVVISDKLLTIFETNIGDIPMDWMMLYFGGNHLNGTAHIANDIYQMVSSLTTHAYAIKSELYDVVMSKLEDAMFPIDIYYAHIHLKYPSYVLQDGVNQLIWQDTGYSDIDESECNYTWLR